MIKSVIFDLSGVLINLKSHGDFDIIQDNFNFAKELKDDYKLGVLSNLSLGYVNKLKKEGFYDIFDVVNLSGETNLLKPDERSYFLILKKLETLPQETIFIDDSYENIKGADKLGIKVILYQNTFDLKDNFYNLIKK